MRKLASPILALLLLTPATPAGLASIGIDQCPAFVAVDQAKLSSHLNGDPTDDRLDAIWANWAAKPLELQWRTSPQAPTLHLETTPGGLQIGLPDVREVAGRRGPDGWEIYAREGERARSEPWALTLTSWREVEVSRSVEDRIDALLAGPCLWTSVRFLEQQVALKNGRYDSRPDGPINYYDVTLGERHWGGMHVSWSVGPPGRLRAILLTAAFGEPEYQVDQIGPDGWFDHPS